MKTAGMTCAIAMAVACAAATQTANAQDGRNRGNNLGRRNVGGQRDLGQVLKNQLENQIRSEVRGEVGLPTRNDQRFGNQQNYGQPGRNGSFGQQWGGRNDYEFNAGRFNQSRGYQFNNDHRQNGRYQSNPLASLIIQQYPEARRILSPRGARPGAFFRNDNRYYYYPNTRPANNFYPNTVTNGTLLQQSTGIQLSGRPVNGGQLQQVGVAANPQPVEIKFGRFAYTDELSQVLPEVLNDLCLDMHYNYRHNPGFKSAYRDAYAALAAAKELRKAHKSNNRDAVKTRLRETDSLLHVVEPSVGGWNRNHQRQIGEFGMLNKLEIATDITHHMMHDAGISLADHEQATSDQTKSSTPAVRSEEAPAPQ